MSHDSYVLLIWLYSAQLRLIRRRQQNTRVPRHLDRQLCRHIRTNRGRVRGAEAGLGSRSS